MEFRLAFSKLIRHGSGASTMKSSNLHKALGQLYKGEGC